MKFSKDGRVFNTVNEAVTHQCCGKFCSACAISKERRGSEIECYEFAVNNQEEFAKLCGFEIVREAPLYEETRIAAKQAQETYEKLMDEQEAKADAGKLQIHMVPMQIVRDCAEVRMYGTAKYGDENNWRKVELIRYIDAMLRHTLSFVDDIHSVDEESGIPHYKHAECNWSFISELMKEMERETDGRVCGETAAAAGE